MENETQPTTLRNTKILAAAASGMFALIGFLALSRGEMLQAAGFLTIAVGYFLGRFYRENATLYRLAIVLSAIGVVLALMHLWNVMNK